MSEMIPLNWNKTKLLDLVETSQAGEWGDEPVGDHNDVFVLRSTNFTNSGIIDYSKLVVRNIAEKKRLLKLLKRGDIVLEKSGGSPSQPVGRVVYFDRDGEFLYSNFTQKLTPSNVVDSKYFFYKLYFEYQNGLVLKFQQQTTGIINFQLSEYLNLRTIFPPKNEQQKIASILTAVDEVIESTQAQINKLKDLKTGMMQELLTKGIGHTEFKDSPVGRIPKDWSILSFSKIIDSSNQGVNTTTEKVNYSVEGVPAIRSNNVKENQLDMTDKKFVAHAVYDRLSEKVKPQVGDILYCNIGSDLGAATVVDRAEKFLITWNILRIVPNRSVVTSKFLSYLLNSNRRELRRSSTESTMPFISSKVLALSEFKIPSISEQDRIVKILESVDTKIFLASQKHSQLALTKKALMQDLLTARKRVLPVSI